MIDENILIKAIEHEMESIEGTSEYASGYEDGFLMTLKLIAAQDKVIPDESAAVSQLKAWLPSMLNCQSHLTAIVSAMMETENIEEGEE